VQAAVFAFGSWPGPMQHNYFKFTNNFFYITVAIASFYSFFRC